MSETVRGTTALQTELQRAKTNLKDVDEDLRKLIGRDPDDPRPAVGGSGGRGNSMQNGRGRERIFSLARRGITSSDGPSLAKRGRMMGGAFSRLGPRVGGRGARRDNYSGDEDELPNKPTVSSSIVASPAEARSRKDSIEESNKDERGKARNRRMFGQLLGTLRRFKDESQEHRDKDDQRRQIEIKLEDKARQEKEELQQKRRELFQERQQKQAKVRLIEQKMELVHMHEQWEEETRKLANFIRTRTKPHLFYLPKAMTPELDKKLRSTQKVVSEMILERRKKLEIEIEDIMNVGNKDDNKDDRKSGDEGHKDGEHGDEGHKDGEHGDEGHKDGEHNLEKCRDHNSDDEQGDKLASRSSKQNNKENKREHRRSKESKSDRRESRKSHDGEMRVSKDDKGRGGEMDPVRSVVHESMEADISKDVLPSETSDLTSKSKENVSDTRVVSEDQGGEGRGIIDRDDVKYPGSVSSENVMIDIDKNGDEGSPSDKREINIKQEDDETMDQNCSQEQLDYM